MECRCIRRFSQRDHVPCPRGHRCLRIGLFRSAHVRERSAAFDRRSDLCRWRSRACCTNRLGARRGIDVASSARGYSCRVRFGAHRVDTIVSYVGPPRIGLGLQAPHACVLPVYYGPPLHQHWHRDFCKAPVLCKAYGVYQKAALSTAQKTLTLCNASVGVGARIRGGVNTILFLSDELFWETHGFPNLSSAGKQMFSRSLSSIPTARPNYVCPLGRNRTDIGPFGGGHPIH